MYEYESDPSAPRILRNMSRAYKALQLPELSLDKAQGALLLARKQKGIQDEIESNSLLIEIMRERINLDKAINYSIKNIELLNSYQTFDPIFESTILFDHLVLLSLIKHCHDPSELNYRIIELARVHPNNSEIQLQI